METFGERLRFARKRAKLSQTALAKRVGIAQQSVGALEAGTAAKSAYTAQLAHETGVEARWLAKGEGPMVKEPSDVQRGARFQVQAVTVEAVLAGKFAPQRAADAASMVALLYARAGTDQEMYFGEDPVEHIQRPPVVAGVPEAYAMRVRGDSMVPMFRPGQIVIVNPFEKLERGCGVIVWKVNQAVLVKEFVARRVREIELRQHNAEPRDFVVPKNEIKALHRIVGAQDF